jgi:chorismate synthase
MASADRNRRIGFKPPATIAMEQPTAKYDGSSGVLAAKGRHDPCVVPRAIPIVEAMAALVLMEWVSACSRSKYRADTCGSMYMIQNSRQTAAAQLPALTHLPPTMVLPGKGFVPKVANGDGKTGEHANVIGDE